LGFTLEERGFMGKSSFPRYGYMIESASQNNFELLEDEDAANTMREILV
jgi:hypothetical protein